MKNYGTYQYINPEYIYHVADGEEGFVVEMIKTFQETIPATVKKLSDAVNAKNVNDILFTAHTLKGSFRFMGCTHLAGIMEQLEKECKKEREQANVLGMMSEAVDVYAKAEKELEDLLSKLNK